LKASILNAVAEDNYILYIILENGNELTLNVEPLFQYPLFATLKDIELWKNMKVGEFSIIWGEGKSKVEISIDKILNYFA
jgi:hypothetical protein